MRSSKSEKVERDVTEEAHRRRDIRDLEREPWLPIAHNDIDVNQRRLDVERQRLALPLGQFRHEKWNHHVKAGEDCVVGDDAMGCAVAHITHCDPFGRLPHIEHGR